MSIPLKNKNNLKTLISSVGYSKNIKGIKFRRNYGKSAALNIGFAKAKGT